MYDGLVRAFPGGPPILPRAVREARARVENLNMARSQRAKQLATMHEEAKRMYQAAKKQRFGTSTQARRSPEREERLIVLTSMDGSRELQAAAAQKGRRPRMGLAQTTIYPSQRYHIADISYSRSRVRRNGGALTSRENSRGSRGSSPLQSGRGPSRRFFSPLATSPLQEEDNLYWRPHTGASRTSYAGSVSEFLGVATPREGRSRERSRGDARTTHFSEPLEDGPAGDRAQGGPLYLRPSLSSRSSRRSSRGRAMTPPTKTGSSAGDAPGAEGGRGGSRGDKGSPGGGQRVPPLPLQRARGATWGGGAPGGAAAAARAETGWATTATTTRSERPSGGKFLREQIKSESRRRPWEAGFPGDPLVFPMHHPGALPMRGNPLLIHRAVGEEVAHARRHRKPIEFDMVGNLTERARRKPRWGSPPRGGRGAGGMAEWVKVADVVPISPKRKVVGRSTLPTAVDLKTEEAPLEGEPAYVPVVDTEEGDFRLRHMGPFKGGVPGRVPGPREVTLVVGDAWEGSSHDGGSSRFATEGDLGKWITAAPVQSLEYSKGKVPREFLGTTSSASGSSARRMLRSPRTAATSSQSGMTLSPRSRDRLLLTRGGSSNSSEMAWEGPVYSYAKFER